MSANPPFGEVQATTCGNCNGYGREPDAPERECFSCRGTALETCRDCGEPSPRLSSLGHCERCSTDWGDVLDCAAVTGPKPPSPVQAYELVCRLRALAESRRQWSLHNAARLLEESC